MYFRPVHTMSLAGSQDNIYLLLVQVLPVAFKPTPFSSKPLFTVLALAHCMDRGKITIIVKPSMRSPLLHAYKSHSPQAIPGCMLGRVPKCITGIILQQTVSEYGKLQVG